MKNEKSHRLGKDSSASRRSSRIRHAGLRPGVESLENRLVLTLTSTVAAGVLTVSSSFNDPIFISASGGNVQVDGVDPGTGTAAASTITAIDITGGPGGSVIDLRSVTPATFTALTNISALSGGGVAQFLPSISVPGTYDGQGTASSLEFDGTATNVILNPSAGLIDVDGKTISIPGSSGPILEYLQTASFTLDVAPNADEIISDNGTTDDGISRASNTVSGQHTDFKAPSGSLTIADTNVGGGTTLEFDGLDATARPTVIALNTGGATDSLVFGGPAANVIENLANSVVSLDGVVVSIANRGLSNIAINTASTNLVIEPAVGTDQVIEDGATPGNGFSRALDAGTGSFTDFRNPTGSLTVQDTTIGGSTFEFDGLDSLGRPATIALNAGGATDTLVFGGTATNVVENLVNSTVTLDGVAVSIANRGLSNILINTTSTNLVIEAAAGTDQIIEDNPTPGDGISRALNTTTGVYTDFKNPTNALAIVDTTGTGGSTYEFDGIDSAGKPNGIFLDAFANKDKLAFGGTATNAVLDLSNGLVALDGKVVSVTGTRSTLTLGTTTANLLIEPVAGGHLTIEDASTPGAGLSRALNVASGSFTDFKNPTNALALVDTSTTGGTTLEFDGIDSASKPLGIFLDTGTAKDTLAFGGTATNVTVDPAKGLVALDGTVVSAAGSKSSLTIGTTSTNLVIEPAAGSHRIIEDGATPGAGISRALDVTSGTYVDFKSPTNALALVDGSTAGGTTLEFDGIDSAGKPKGIFLDAVANKDTLAFGGTAINAILDLANGLVALDGTVVSLAGSQSSVMLGTTTENLLIKPVIGGHLTIEDASTPGAGLSRALNVASGSFTDFKNPTNEIEVLDTSTTGGTTLEFDGLDTTGRPYNIILAANGNADTLVFSGPNVENEQQFGYVYANGIYVQIPGSSKSTVVIK